jgi:hypothetical protein
MKRLINIGLSALLVIATAATAQAQTPLRLQSLVIANSTMVSSTNTLSPFDLVSFARRGYFKDQGIPGYGAFDNDYVAGKITPESLVKGAIAAQRLNPEALNDSGYLNAVDLQLFGVHSEGL